jgi:LSD1 subclass zinc finger protein
MQTFTCPQCGHESTYDPWVESAHCAECGYEPTQGRRITHHPSARRETATHQPLLDELLAHWNDTHTPDLDFSLQTSDEALAFFADYQRMLGESPGALSGYVEFLRNYQPNRGEILAFVGAYLLLKKGHQAEAVRHLRALTTNVPQFPDPWIWLTATTDDPAERREYLESAVTSNPSHPLANDAMALLLGRVSPEAGPRDGQPGQPVTTIKCPQCAGELHYEPGATEVVCPYCNHQVPLQQVNVLDGEATLVGDIRLKRRYQRHTWEEVGRILHCQSCGAELTMSHHLSQQCVFCSSTNVLIEDNEWAIEQPDGFLPFAVSEEQAIEAIGEAQRAGLRRLKTLFTGKDKEQGVLNLQGVYVPFWVFDGFVDVRAWSEGMSAFGPRSGLAEELGEGKMMFDNLMFVAADIPALSRLERVFPYTLGKMTPYEPRFLADWPALLYNRDVDAAAIKADRALLTMARDQAGALIAPSGQSSSRPAMVRRSFQTSGLTYQLVLLPVWVAVVQVDDERRLALVNGQTGKATLGPALSED